MGAGNSFCEEVAHSWKSCTKDKGDVEGAASAGFSTICFFPCMFVWNVCTAPAHWAKGDIMPIGIGVLGTIVSIIPIICVFAAFVVPGAVAAGIGALGRLIKIW